MADNLYEQLGGKPAFEALVDYFYAQVLLDFELKPYFEGVDMKRLRDHQVQFLASVAGGPEYRGRDIKESHVGRNISPAAFQKVADHLAQALDHFKVPAPAKEAILNAVRGMADDVIGL